MEGDHKTVRERRVGGGERGGGGVWEAMKNLEVERGGGGVKEGGWQVARGGIRRQPY